MLSRIESLSVGVLEQLEILAPMKELLGTGLPGTQPGGLLSPGWSESLHQVKKYFGVLFMMLKWSVRLL